MTQPVTPAAVTPPAMTDPRLHGGLNTPLDGENAIVPQIAKSRPGLAAPALLGIAGLSAVLLFAVLETRRQSAMAPPVQVQPADGKAAARMLPPLVTPYWWEPSYDEQPVGQAEPTLPQIAAPLPETRPAPAPRIQRSAEPLYGPPTPYEPAPPPPRVSPGSPLVGDSGFGFVSPGNPALATQGAASGSDGGGALRARAAKFAGPSTTVPQGWLIPATLETALDSTRPGFARAIVSRPVYSFDGTRILIPRGSRLIGEYGSEAAPGQKRALIRWTRLIRPDGVTIALDSPATDTLGRGGVKARVNSHFFARFAGSILQSALNIGENIAAREAGSSVVVALPGAQISGLAQNVPASQITPTLSVKPGTRVSVFVARDLDFADVEPPR